MNTCFRGPPLNLTVQCFLWYAMVGVANSLTISALSQDTIFQHPTSHFYVFVR